jgi:hypothetical protein
MSAGAKHIICSYCGTPSAATVDHVVPSALYPPSKASSRVQRITVPACFPCNQGFARDEVQFRNVLLLCGHTAVTREVWEGSTRRSFGYADGHKRLVDLAAQMVPVETPEGPRHMVYPARDERVMRIVRKVIRGLSRHHELPWPVQDGQIFADVQRFEAPPEIVGTMTSAHAEEDVLQYQFASADPDMHSLWLLRFYKRATFVGLVYRTIEDREQIEACASAK